MLLGILCYVCSVLLWLIAAGLGCIGLVRLAKGGPGNSTQDILRGAVGAGMVMGALLIGIVAKELWAYAGSWL